eukprot:scaffold1113_cov379-Prasinococcus_capsulatus_cf.AAC.6
MQTGGRCPSNPFSSHRLDKAQMTCKSTTPGHSMPAPVGRAYSASCAEAPASSNRLSVSLFRSASSLFALVRVSTSQFIVIRGHHVFDLVLELIDTLLLLDGILLCTAQLSVEGLKVTREGVLALQVQVLQLNMFGTQRFKIVDDVPPRISLAINHRNLLLRLHCGGQQGVDCVVVLLHRRHSAIGLHLRVETR